MKLDEERILQLISKEFIDKQEKTSQKYVDMIKKLQTSLQEVEENRDEIDDELHSLETQLHHASAEKKALTEQLMVLEHNYNKLIMEYEILENKDRENEETIQKIKTQSLEVERSLRTRMHSESNEQEKQIHQLESQLEAITKDRDSLLVRYNDVLSTKTMTEEIQTLQRTQLNDVMNKYTEVSTENERMKRKLDSLLQDKKMMTDMLEEKTRELNEIRDNYSIEIHKLELQHANALKQKEYELVNQNPITTLNMDDLQDRLRNMTGLTPLNIDEKDHAGSIMINPNHWPSMRMTVRPSNVVIRSSNRDVVQVRNSGRDLIHGMENKTFDNLDTEVRMAVD
jgi:chromosome segregation ATPase